MSDIPTVVGVLGGGRMGAGIAHAFVVAGSTVRIVERDDEQAAAALDRVTDGARRQRRPGNRP